MKFTSYSYALLSPSKNELKIVLHFCMALSLSRLLRSKCKFRAPTLVSKLNPFFTFRPGRLTKFSLLRANVAKNRLLTRPGTDSGSDQISDLIGSDSGSDRIRLICAELLFLRKSCFNNDTGGSDFFLSSRLCLL